MSNAILCPGQGSQLVGMGKDLADSIPECAKLYNIANEVMGCDLKTVSFDGPIETLTRSSNAQPAIFVASVACNTAITLKNPDMTFSAAAGLSSGEWTALYYAGVLSFEDTLKVLEARGRFMQEACEEKEGAMCSIIGMDVEGVTKVAETAGVEVANYNSPAQTVLSGSPEGIKIAETVAKEAGAKMAVVLNVAGAFHSSFMQPAADRLTTFLEAVEFTTPSYPVLCNVTGEPHDADGNSIRKRMAEQVTSSVRWVSCIEWMRANGIERFVECGPGKVLSGLVRRIDKKAMITNIQDLPGVEAFAGEAN